MKFANERTIPPGGWYFYTVPETGVTIKSLTRVGFFDKIRKHYGENSLECPDDLEDLVMDFMCRRLPRGFCHGEGSGSVNVVTMSDVKRRTVQAAAGQERVTPGEAKERAAICGRCKLNDRSACPTCSGLNAWASRLGGVKVPGSASYLGICRADGLATSAGVALKDAPVDKDEVPEHCWRRKV